MRDCNYPIFRKMTNNGQTTTFKKFTTLLFDIKNKNVFALSEVKNTRESNGTMRFLKITFLDPHFLKKWAIFWKKFPKLIFIELNASSQEPMCLPSLSFKAQDNTFIRSHFIALWIKDVFPKNGYFPKFQNCITPKRGCTM